MLLSLSLSLQISGCIILGVAIYLKVDKDGHAVRLCPVGIPSFRIWTEFYFENPRVFRLQIATESLPGVDLMIAIGVIILVLGFLGCCGAIRENRCLLLLVR